MVDLNKINSQLDLKNLDAEKIIKLLNEHQHTIIKIVLIAGTLVIAGTMFNDYRTKDQALRTQLSQAQHKLDVIKARDVAVGNISALAATLPKKINEFELITLISSYAKLYHVIIPSLSPTDSSDMGLYDVIEVGFNAQSDSFKDMVLFLRKIEKSEFPLRIDSWSGQRDDGGGVSFVLKISAVLIHT